MRVTLNNQILSLSKFCDRTDFLQINEDLGIQFNQTYTQFLLFDKNRKRIIWHYKNEEFFDDLQFQIEEFLLKEII